MATEENLSSQRKVEQRLGEIVLYIPILAAFIGIDFLLNVYLSPICLTVIVTVAIMRQFFPFSFHETDNHKICLVVSYVSIIVLTLCGLAFPNQPLFVIILCGLFCYVNNYIGKRNAIAEYRLMKLQAPPPFALTTCTEAQLRQRCRELGFKPDKIDNAVKHFVLKLEHKIINPLRPESSETERNRMRKLLSK